MSLWTSDPKTWTKLDFGDIDVARVLDKNMKKLDIPVEPQTDLDPETVKKEMDFNRPGLFQDKTLKRTKEIYKKYWPDNRLASMAVGDSIILTADTYKNFSRLVQQYNSLYNQKQKIKDSSGSADLKISKIEKDMKDCLDKIKKEWAA